MNYSIESIERVFDNEVGYVFEIGEDSDGIGLPCIRWGESIKNFEGESPAMNPQIAKLVGEALIRIAEKYMEKSE